MPVFGILGPLQVVGSAPLRITSPQERRLLGALLLRRNRWVGVGEAEDAIWGDQRPATHRLTLQTKVSRLRRLVGPGRLVSGPDGYELRTDPGECDADEFEDLCGQLSQHGPGDAERQLARAEQALALWRGRVLGDLCDEPFVGSEAVRLEQLRLTVEERRLELLLRIGRWGEVIAATERLMAQNPYHEGLCLTRMQALAHSGRLVDAVRTYQRFRRQLVDDVGIEPSARLVALESRLLAGDELGPLRPERPTTGTARSRPAALVAWNAPISTQPRFVGREETVAALRRSLFRGPAARAALLSGAGGIGKTRLASEMMAAARGQGLPVEVLRCRPSRTLLEPFGRQVVDWRSPGVREQTIANLSRRLEETVQDGLVVLEDLHWADGATLDVLTSFATAVLTRDRHARLLVTSRPLEPDSEPAGWWTAVSRELPSTSIELRGLSGPEVFGLVRQATGCDPTPALADLLRERGGGNPLLALTGLEGLRSVGGLQSDGAVLTVEDVEFRSVPADLRSLLADVERALRPEARDVLAEASLFLGDPHIADLPSTAAWAEAEVQDVLLGAEEAGVASVRGGRVVFRHDLYRRVLAETQSAASQRARRRAIIQRLLVRQATIESTAPAVGPLRELARELAHHAEQVADAVPAADLVEIMRRAGLHALGDLDWPNAARWLDHALRLAPSCGLDPAAWLDLRQHAGAAHFRNHDAREALPLLEEVVDDAEAVGDVEGWGVALLDLCRATAGLSNTGPAAVRAKIEQFVADPRSDPRSRARLLSVCAEHHFAHAGNEAARELLERANALLGRAVPPLLQAELAFAAGLVELGDVRLDEAFERFERSVAAAGDADSSWVASWGLGRMAFVRLVQGRFADGRRVAEVARSTQLHSASWSELSFTAVLQAELADLDGDDERCVARLQESERLLQRSGYQFTALFLFPLIVQRALASGDVDAARSALDRWEAVPARVPRVHQTLVELMAGRPASGESHGFRPLPPSAGVGAGTGLVAQVAVAVHTGDSQLADASRQLLLSLAERGVHHLPSARRGVDSMLDELDGVVRPGGPPAR